MIPIASLAFGLGGALIQMQEELIAFVPVLLLLTSRLGYSPLVAAAVSIGAAAVAAAFSPVNPFQVVIAQKVAELPPQSGFGFRMVFLALAIAVGYDWREVAVLGALAVVIVGRHAANLRRLVRGEEPQLPTRHEEDAA